MPTTGVQSAGNLALTYFDGAMLANDEQFYLYGYASSALSKRISWIGHR